MTKTTKTILWLIVIVIVIGGIWYAVSRGPAPEEGVIKIGVILPLSGKASFYGEATKEGLELAAEEINKKGINKKKIKIIYEDDQSNPKDAVSSALKLIDIEKVPIIITSISPTSMAVAPIAQENGVILFATVAQAKDLIKTGDYIFRINPAYTLQGKKLANFAFDKKNYKTAGTIHAADNDAMVDAKNAFIKTFIEKGGEIIVDESYLSSDADMRTQLIKIKYSNPDVIILFGLVKDSGQVLKQKGELGIDIPFLACSGVEDSRVLEVAGNAANDVIFATANIIPPEWFKEKIRTKFEHEYLRYTPESWLL